MTQTLDDKTLDDVLAALYALSPRDLLTDVTVTVRRDFSWDARDPQGRLVAYGDDIRPLQEAAAKMNS